uniref:major facilitator superfamily domain-containing protein 9-like n=1 Tax=Styela clava TaxID=7725 RepID=UPI001939DDE4|nr:major facilitator superfamily domain-containing protein 9-like [Styela clava]
MTKKNRNLQARHFLLYLIGFLDMLAISLVVPAFPVHIKSFGASSTLTGAITSIYGALQLFSSPLVGKWSDSRGRLNAISACLIISSTGYLFSGFFVSSLVSLALLRIIPGIFKHTQDLCRCCLIEESGHNKNQAIGSFNAIASIGFIIGPTVHGHLVANFGHTYGLYISYMICASLFLLNFLVVSILRFYPNHELYKPMPTQKSHKNGFNHENGVTENTANVENITDDLKRFQRGVFASRFLLALPVLMFRSTFVLWLTHYHPDLASTTVGYIVSYNGFLGLFFGFLVGTVSNLAYYKGHEEKLQMHASCLVLLSFILFLISSKISVILVAMTTLTMGTSVLRVCGVVLTVKYSESCDIGHIQGLGSSVLSVARFGAPLANGILQELSFSAPNAFSIFLGSLSIAVFYYDSYLYRERKLKM